VTTCPLCGDEVPADDMVPLDLFGVSACGDCYRLEMDQQYALGSWKDPQ
jgi:ribosome-binding protein aMBF1 (putative translation factor)